MYLQDLRYKIKVRPLYVAYDYTRSLHQLVAPLALVRPGIPLRGVVGSAVFSQLLRSGERNAL